MASVDHFKTWRGSLEEILWLVCSQCMKKVKEHILINEAGETVWPPPQEWIDAQPIPKKRKRCRRKVLLEQEPEGYKVRYE